MDKSIPSAEGRGRGSAQTAAHFLLHAPGGARACVRVSVCAHAHAETSWGPRGAEMIPAVVFSPPLLLQALWGWILSGEGAWKVGTLKKQN